MPETNYFSGKRCVCMKLYEDHSEQARGPGPRKPASIYGHDWSKACSDFILSREYLDYIPYDETAP